MGVRRANLSAELMGNDGAGQKSRNVEKHARKCTYWSDYLDWQIFTIIFIFSIIIIIKDFHFHWDNILYSGGNSDKINHIKPDNVSRLF